jgi:hypothetical protein
MSLHISTANYIKHDMESKILEYIQVTQMFRREGHAAAHSAIETIPASNSSFKIINVFILRSGVGYKIFWFPNRLNWRLIHDINELIIFFTISSAFRPDRVTSDIFLMAMPPRIHSD